MLTPYIDEVNAAIHGFLTGAGLDVVEFASFHLGTEPEIAAELPDKIDELDHCGLTAEQMQAMTRETKCATPSCDGVS